MLVGNDQIGADLLADGNHHQLETAGFQEFLEMLAGISACRHNAYSLPPERLDHARSIDAAPARRLTAGVDVGPIVKHQAVNGNRFIDRWINSDGDDQAFYFSGVERCYSENCAAIRN